MSVESINIRTLRAAVGVGRRAGVHLRSVETALAQEQQGVVGACGHYAVNGPGVSGLGRVVDAWSQYDTHAGVVLEHVSRHGGGQVSVSSFSLQLALVMNSQAQQPTLPSELLDDVLAQLTALQGLDATDPDEHSANLDQISELLSELVASGVPIDIDRAVALMMTHGLTPIAAITAAGQGDDTDRESVADPRMALFLGIDEGTHFDTDIAAIALAQGWTYEEAQLRLRLIDISMLPDDQIVSHLGEIDALSIQLAGIDFPTLTDGMSGDLGGTHSTEIRTPFALAGGTNAVLGRQAIIQMLTDTGTDPGQIRRDEFEMIYHDNGKVTIVLPGVIDLSKPGLGLDPLTRSVRDTDQYAVPSSFSADAADNQYAMMVMEQVRQQILAGVIPLGADVMIVGHSFGADTAVDLASSPAFNGDMVNVTHVVAAAYHTEAQLSEVEPGTQVVVLQNNVDIPVIAEGLGADITDAVTGSNHSNGSGGEGLGNAFIELGEAGINALADGADAVVDAMEDGFEGEFNIEVDVPDIPTLDIPTTSVEAVNDEIVLAEFDGGFHLMGHHQDNYNEYIESTDNELLDDAFTAIAEAGYADNGVSVAVDVSVPEEELTPECDEDHEEFDPKLEEQDCFG